MRPSRREFVKWVTASGISLSLSRLATASRVEFRRARDTAGTAELESGRQWRRPHRRRRQGHRCKTLRIRFSCRRHAGLAGDDLARAAGPRARCDACLSWPGSRALSGASKPSVVVTAADLENIGTRVPEFYAGDLFCPLGKTPLYLGQPVALLIFEKFDAFDRARLALRDGTFVKFGEETGPVAMPDYAAFRFTRVAGPTPEAPDVYSPIQAGWVSPGVSRIRTLPVWTPFAKETGRPTARPRCYGEQIRAELAADNPDAAGAGSPVRDPVGRSDVSRTGMRPRLVQRRTTKKLELVLGVQSPYEAAESIAFLLGEARAPFKPAHIKRPFRLYGRRLRRPRPYALPALCRAGGDVLSRPSGAAGA